MQRRMEDNIRIMVCIFWVKNGEPRPAFSHDAPIAVIP
jgi:hypothetical protein